VKAVFFSASFLALNRCKFPVLAQPVIPSAARELLFAIRFS